MGAFAPKVGGTEELSRASVPGARDSLCLPCQVFVSPWHGGPVSATFDRVMKVSLT